MKSNRRSFIKSAGLLTGISMLPMQEVLAMLFSDEQAWRMTNLRGNVGLFTERGGTIGWMISPNGIVVIDSQYREQAEHLIGEIRTRSLLKVDILFNTHHHGDHTAGNVAFKLLAGHIVAHENSKKNQVAAVQRRGNSIEQVYPDLTFANTFQRKIGDETIRAYYFGPAHTDGDSIIHFEKDNVVHVGDLIFNRRYPFIDKAAGASIENWISVLEKTRNQFDNDTIFIFGHANEGYPVSGNKEDLKAMENYLASLLNYMTREMKSGKSLDELLKTKSIPGAEEWTGKGIERSINSAWEELIND
ncbi:MAG: MBL fold metallo-hydrolase [Bacteroidota bacterium]|nr:MBL fold metallo-hydrolase [Bacteroidota bacterium]